MKQTRLLLITAVVLLTAIFSSCKDSNELTNAIPSGSFMVLHIDTKSLLTKADYKPLENKYIKEALERQKSSGREDSKKAIEWLEAFLKNPNTSGIDILGDCYMYMDSTSFGIVLGMSDAKKFKETLTTFNLPEQMIKEADGISTIDMSGMAKIGWTDKKIIIASYTSSPYQNSNLPDLLALLKKQLKQTESESINTNKSFASFLKDRKDISIFYSYDNIAGMWNNAANSMLGFYNEGLTTFFAALSGTINSVKDKVKGVNLGVYVSFEKGEIIAENKTYFETPESEKNYSEIQALASKELSGNHFNYLNEKPLISMAGGINGNGFYTLLTNLGVIELIRSSSGSQLEDMGINIQSLLTNIDGDITVILSEVKSVIKTSSYSDYEYTYTDEYPLFALFADQKDAKPTWDLIINKLTLATTAAHDSDSIFTQIDANTYSLMLDNNFKTYLGVVNNTLYVTNDENIYNNIKSSTPKNNDFAALAKGKLSFLYGNIASLKPLATSNIENNPKALELAIKGLDLLGDYSYAAEKNAGRGKIVINDNSANSLAVITKYIDSVITIML